MARVRPTRSERLLRAVQDYERVVVVTHDNPDPDAIAAGWAVHRLMRERFGRPTTLVGGGDIVRAENRHMVELLRPPLELVDTLPIDDATAAILVDCSSQADNHLLAKEGVRPVAVIDHHARGPARRRLPFRDVRPKVAAAASITGSYLREQSIEPKPRLATALTYAIRTETSGGQSHHSRLDRSVLRWLAGFSNPAWIAEIANAPLPQVYFDDLALALGNARLYGDVAFSLLPAASGAEIVGEVADLLIRCEAVTAVLCAAIVADDLIVSVRTAIDGRDATALVTKTLAGLGGGGGHAQRAGGKIAAATLAGKSVRAIEDELRSRWLDACGIEKRRATRLVAPT